MTRRCVACVVLLAALGCARREQSSRAEAEDLEEGVAARVGNELIRVEAVQAVAGAQGVSLGEARERLVRDALFALAAREQLVPAQARVAERAALSRAVLEAIERQAQREAPPTPADVERISAERWWELDRPAAARTTHVVVLVGEPDQDAEARALAGAIADAVRGIEEPRSFVERAYAVPRGSLEIKAERLPPVTADGRIVPAAEPVSGEPTGRFEAPFAEAANAIVAEGTHSPVVRTQYGYHVILLEQKLPEKRLSFAERRSAVADHLMRERARQILERELERLRSETPVDKSRAVDSLTAEVELGARR